MKAEILCGIVFAYFETIDPIFYIGYYVFSAESKRGLKHLKGS